MRITLFVLASFSFLFAVLILSRARSAVHEIEAFIVFVIAAVLLSGGAITDAITEPRRARQARQRQRGRFKK